MFTERIVKEIVMNAVEITPGLIRDDKNKVTVDNANKLIDVEVSCIDLVNCYEVLLMARNLIAHFIYSYTGYKSYKVNVCLRSI